MAASLDSFPHMPEFHVSCEKLNKVFAGSGSPAARFLLNRPPQDVHAVKDMSFSVAPGEILGVMGPNGAGKTTLIKMLCTLLVPTSGTASVCGADVLTEPERVRRDIAFITGDERSFYWRLTGMQNLQFFGGLLGLSPRQARDRIATLAAELGVLDILDRRFDTYSTGNRQKIAIARGLLNDARVLFLDEPTRSLDPTSALSFTATIRDRIARGQGRSVIFVTHRLEEALGVCDRLLIMRGGEAAFLGKPSDMQALGSQEGWRIQVRGDWESASLVPGRPAGLTVSLYHSAPGRDKDGICLDAVLEEGASADLGDVVAWLTAARMHVVTAEPLRRSSAAVFAELTGDDEP